MVARSVDLVMDESLPEAQQSSQGLPVAQALPAAQDTAERDGVQDVLHGNPAHVDQNLLLLTNLTVCLVLV